MLVALDVERGGSMGNGVVTSEGRNYILTLKHGHAMAIEPHWIWR